MDETVGQRIKRLRLAQGWSRPELGRRMGVALGRKHYAGEMIRLYEEGENRPGKDARRGLALAFEREESYIEFGDTSQSKLRPHDPDESRARDGKEEILLHLYRGLFTLQQQRLVTGLRALFDANQITRKELGQKPLRGVSDDQVVKAFGKIPVRKRVAKSDDRQLGDAMGDFLDP